MQKLNIIVPKQKKKIYSYKDECKKFDAMNQHLYGKSSVKEDNSPIFSNPFMEFNNE